ncbi:hypothetical protein ACFQI7_27715 [Paenibacillus allorhizosphaerae]|uniref:Uncharacterized protein n=1 Tax=Paenibacillus allorhizosphaerae TaxID=2849866 RepID=A0ABN7TR69_9BACL|nr:hypothetical protein [Paenibacillus allorhizosphaerae]CAG7651792.1 hypothetical protein PAECIP111802_05072 [Paenibacillus allorhizosphaerae]
MMYHVIHKMTHELKILNPADVLDMDTDSEGRIIVHGADQQIYFLLASKDLVID